MAAICILQDPLNQVIVDWGGVGIDLTMRKSDIYKDLGVCYFVGRSGALLRSAGTFL